MIRRRSWGSYTLMTFKEFLNRPLDDVLIGGEVNAPNTWTVMVECGNCDYLFPGQFIEMRTGWVRRYKDHICG